MSYSEFHQSSKPIKPNMYYYISVSVWSAYMSVVYIIICMHTSTSASVTLCIYRIYTVPCTVRVPVPVFHILVYRYIVILYVYIPGTTISNTVQYRYLNIVPTRAGGLWRVCIFGALRSTLIDVLCARDTRRLGIEGRAQAPATDALCSRAHRTSSPPSCSR